MDADGRIRVGFDDRFANCCPSPAATFTTDGPNVLLHVVTQSSTTSSGCDCFCVSDFVVTSEPFAAGDYTLEVVFDGNDVRTLDVVVP